jgi:phosphatidylinositol 4-kinase
MKSTLDTITDMVVRSLSGAAREFYDREFNFFNEVTSISGKLKPFIKKTKPEKKVRRFHENQDCRHAYAS